MLCERDAINHHPMGEQQGIQTRCVSYKLSTTNDKFTIEASERSFTLVVQRMPELCDRLFGDQGKAKFEDYFGNEE